MHTARSRPVVLSTPLEKTWCAHIGPVSTAEPQMSQKVDGRIGSHSPKAIIFDLDGLLLDTGDHGRSDMRVPTTPAVARSIEHRVVEQAGY